MVLTMSVRIWPESLARNGTISYHQPTAVAGILLCNLKESDLKMLVKCPCGKEYSIGYISRVFDFKCKECNNYVMFDPETKQLIYEYE